MRDATKTIIEAALKGDTTVSKRKRQAILDLLDRPDEELAAASAAPPSTDEFMTQSEAARLLNIGRSTLYRMEKDGQLKPVILRPGQGKIRPGGLKRYRKSDILALSANKKQEKKK